MNELIKLENDTYLLDTETAKKIAEFEILAKDIKTKQDELKEAIRLEMLAKNIKSIKDEINGVSITYIPETEREMFDTKKFREDNEELYNDYVKFSKVKDSIRIKVS